jgi:PAS domain-containing protein
MTNTPAPASRIQVAGITVAWQVDQGTCAFERLPVAMMWVDTTLAGLMAGIQAMVGTERFLLSLQSEGRKSVEADWGVIAAAPSFPEGFKAIAVIAAVAGWGRWELMELDQEQHYARFRIHDGWEGLYQKALGVVWGSGMVGGKLAGYCGRLFGTNCWAEQTAFIARGDPCDEFTVKPSARSIEQEIDQLLATDEATRADMAVALRRLETEIGERRRVEEELRRSRDELEVRVQERTAALVAANAELTAEIAERARVAEALHASEQNLGLLLERLPAGVVVHGPDSRVLFSNPKAARLLGLTEDQILGRQAMDPRWRFVREDGTVLPHAEYPVVQVLASGRPLVDMAVGVDRPATNDRVWGLVNAYPDCD